jgi:hypothetical protein
VGRRCERPRRSLRARPGESAAKLTREQRKLFEQLKETLPAENQPSERGLFDKVKDYFM